MNFRNILSSIFKANDTPTLDEFVNTSKPTDTAHVEFLEKEYDRLYGVVYLHLITK